MNDTNTHDRQLLHRERLEVLQSMTYFGVTPTSRLVDLVARIILNLERAT